MNQLSRKINKLLPLYVDLHTFKRILGTSNNHYTFAIWNCGRRDNLLHTLADLRITIRKGAEFWTIKKGYV